jgi:hypothetical protein
MTLPVVPLPTKTVDLGDGATVDIKALSRAAALKVTTGYRDPPRPDEAENFIVAMGCGVTEAEAAKWRAATDPAVAGKVIDAILELSSLTETEADPQP